MSVQHIQETLVDTLEYNGLCVDVVDWKETIWCGKIGYAVNNTEEPDVEKIAKEAAEIFPQTTAAGREEHWEVCLSLNYLCSQRPNGVMFGFLVQTDRQPECYDIVKFPAARYMKIAICEKTFRSLGVTPWTGGIPPYEWIGERIAPKFGYQNGEDTLPIVEYYQLDPTNGHAVACYLYVPVKERL
ncbi:MAG: hypothetical protein IJC25_06830 [Clostridia bacterium]|nr:hypothetical protein [Clostridia bacterium]